MARDPNYVHIGLLVSAMEQARPLLRWPISRVEMKGSLIRVDAPDEAVYFRVNVSHSVRVDEATGQHFPLAGGESYDLALISESGRVEADARWQGAEQPWLGVTSTTHTGNVRFVFTIAAAIAIAAGSYLIGLWVGSR